jgi:hypothetical protein
LLLRFASLNLRKAGQWFTQWVLHNTQRKMDD